MPARSEPTDPDTAAFQQAEQVAAKTLRKKHRSFLEAIGAYVTEFFPRTARSEIELNPRVIDGLSPKELATTKSRAYALAEAVSQEVPHRWTMDFLFPSDSNATKRAPHLDVGESGLPLAWESDLRIQLGYMSDLFPGQFAAWWTPRPDYGDSPYLGPINAPRTLLDATSELIAAHDTWLAARQALQDRETQIARVRALVRWDATKPTR
jgi:hypothetical protein